MSLRRFLLVLILAALVAAACRGAAGSASALPHPAEDDLPPGSMPELPRVAVDLPPAAIPAATRTLSASDDLQRAIDDAKPGEVIALPAGAVFRGSITLPKKSGDGWITIRTTTPEHAFPGRGTRVNPVDAALMPVIESDRHHAIVTDHGAHHYRFIGIAIRPRPQEFVANLVQIGDDERSVEALPHHIVFERCYIHGDPERGGRRGIAMNGRHIAVLDSYVSDFKEEGNDSQALSGWNGSGPFLIRNNYLEGAGENVMFGGADPDITNLVPSDIEVCDNHFAKPLSWRGTKWSVKNLFELKNARRVLIDSNVFENNWVHAQNGFAILFTPRNQDGGSPWSVVRDVTFTRNVVRHASAGMNILGTDDIHPSQQTKRITIRDNIFEDVNGDVWDGSGRLFQLLDGPADVVIEHNTAFHTGDVVAAEGMPSIGFVYRNNLTPHNRYGVGGRDTYGNPRRAIAMYFPGAIFTRNVLIGGRADDYPPDNFFPSSVAEVGFVDVARGDYRLHEDSVFRGKATDGSDIGARSRPPEARAGRRRAAGRGAD